MKVRDLFAGYGITLSPHVDQWAIAPMDLVTVFSNELSEAISACHEWVGSARAGNAPAAELARGWR